MDELNKFSKRIKRYASLGTSASSFALNFVGTKFFNKENQDNAEELSRVLGNLKGPIMKIAQLLAKMMQAQLLQIISQGRLIDT